MILSFILYILVIFSTYLSSIFIRYKFVKPPIVRDLLWECLPIMNLFWISEVIIGLSVFVLIFYAIKEDKYYIPYFWIMVSTFQLVRAVLIILTPLGIPSSYSGFLIGNETMMAFGTYPSGHLAYPFLTFLLTKKPIALFFSFLVATILILSRGHYTIDLVGTITLGFSIYVLFEFYLKKYFIRRSLK